MAIAIKTIVTITNKIIERTRNTFFIIDLKPLTKCRLFLNDDINFYAHKTCNYIMMDNYINFLLYPPYLREFIPFSQLPG